MKREITVVTVSIAIAVALCWFTWDRRATASDAIEAAVPVPVAWIGTPEITGTRIEVDAPVVIPNETSYTQTVVYRHVIEYRVQMGIALD